MVCVFSLIENEVIRSNEDEELSIIEKVNSPADVKNLSYEELSHLCDELRQYLIENVAVTGGHLASNLGVVELTVALHRVFDTTKDRLVFDVGHQSYIHKLLTGRRENFTKLRSAGGLSGFPKPSESEHDAFVAGHASSAISVALGMARARSLLKEDYTVAAIVGDGALTGGLAYEGLNDAGQSGTPLIVVLNDNGMSIRKNVGGLSRYLARIRVKPSYFRFKKLARSFSQRFPGGRKIYHFFKKIKDRIKQSILACRLFEDMGFYYIGPVDGYDIPKLEYLLRTAREMGTPVLIHVITQKGRGYMLSEREPELYHGVSGLDSRTGAALHSTEKSFSDIFGELMCECAQSDERVCAISAAMLPGTGLEHFAYRFPSRCFDVAIAEEHAVSMAGGMAKQGLIPVFAVYSTFLQRCYDQIMQDVAMLNLHVVLAVDRAGLIGEDGQTHQGVFDASFLPHFPGMSVFAPSNNAELRSMFMQAMYSCSGPVALRYPRGSEGSFVLDTSDKPCFLAREGKDVTILTYGRLINEALGAAEILKGSGISAEVLKLNRITPLELEEVFASGRKTGRLLIAEENTSEGSVGERIAAKSIINGHKFSIVASNLGQCFISHGTVKEQLSGAGLDAKGIAKTAMEGFDFGHE